MTFPSCVTVEQQPYSQKITSSIPRRSFSVSLCLAAAETPRSNTTRSEHQQITSVRSSSVAFDLCPLVFIIRHAAPRALVKHGSALILILHFSPKGGSWPRPRTKTDKKKSVFLSSADTVMSPPEVVVHLSDSAHSLGLLIWVKMKESHRALCHDHLQTAL